MVQLFIGAAVLLVWYILSKNRGEREPNSAMWVAVGFGVISLIVAGVLEAVLLPVDIGVADKLSGTQLVTVSMAVGVIEEVSKFIPLALFIYKKSYFREYNDGVLYFALAGLGFGVPENILYTLSGGVGTGLVRLIMTPFFHAATTAFIGYILIRMKLRRQSILPVIGAVLLMIFVHAAYDFGLLSGKLGFIGMAVLLTFGLNVLLVVLVSHARKRDDDVLRNQLNAATWRQQIARTALASIYLAPPIAQPASRNTPHQAPVAVRQNDGLAITALVVGILAFLAGIIPFLGLVLGIPALIMGAFAYRHQQGMALGAIITGSIGALAGLAWTALFIIMLVMG